VLLPDADPLHKVTIIPRGWLSATMRVACGGRIAEQRATGDISSGAAGDISQVTSLARVMIEEWGMSERLGFIRYRGEDSRNTFLPDREYSDDTAQLIDEEVRRLVDEAYRDAERLLDENWEKVEAVAEALLKYETISGEEVQKVMRGEPLGRSSLADILAGQRRTPPPPPAAPDTDEDTPPGLLPSPA
jgi:cell division protease FtsH